MLRQMVKTMVLMFAVTLLHTSCISTKSVPDGDQLFVGLSKITYDTDTLIIDDSQFAFRMSNYLDDTKAELEAALATAPNGALFGSSYYRSPFSWRLWVYNRFSGKDSKFARWMTKTFGRQPVLMSQVNPALRASVAQSVLRNNGFFRGTVDYETLPLKNSKKGKIRYRVRLDTLFTYDSIAYMGYPQTQQQLIDSTANDALVKLSLPFNVSNLEGERSRISTLMRNNGYYYYQSGYTTFLADTIATPGRARLRIQLVDGIPDMVLHQWYIGNIDINLRRSVREQLTDSLKRGHLNIHYSGLKAPMRPRVLLKNMRLFPRRQYNHENYQETAARINATGVFSAVDFQFTPRGRDTLDLRLNCTFDKPYDFYFETNFNARTIGRFGPEVKVGFAKRNAFHGGERLDVNLHGNYEWQQSGAERVNSYQYGLDASIDFPRVIAPFYDSDRVRRTRDGHPRRRRWLLSTPTTMAKLSFDIVQRPQYYRMHVATGEWTYQWQSSLQSRHQLSPLTLKYQRINTSTAKFDSLMENNSYLAATMEDLFIPKMRYTYAYTSPTTKRNPIRWETTIEEAGNFMALFDQLVQGHAWNQEDKTLFRNPYAQFVRIETDLTKTWQLTPTSQLVGHINAGVLRCFGNTNKDGAPFSEMFYAGGANSIRAFTVRSIGPGSFSSSPDGLVDKQRQFSYLMQNGDIKLVANLEYRSRLFGSLSGAVFLDAGNVWRWSEPDLTHDDMADLFGADEYNSYSAEVQAMVLNYMRNWFSGWQLKPSTLLKQIALGTGVGLRYDLGFLVIRLDWGLALHTPYNTNRSGYFNIGSFHDAQALHFAIGYPF